MSRRGFVVSAAKNRLSEAKATCAVRVRIAASELRPENLTNAMHPAIHTVCGVKEGERRS